MKLKNKTILITGASRGIGREAAIAFAKEGATTVLMATNEDALNEVYDEIESLGLPQSMVVPFNFETAPEEAYFQLRDGLAQTFDSIDGILHNASQLGARTPLTNYNWQTWRKVMSVNVDSQFLLTKALFPLLESSESASVLFTSSSVGRKGRAYWGAYSISKFATEGMMQVFAEEFESMGNIRANSINPGATRTDMRMSAYPAENPNDVKPASELMNQYIYLMSDESKTVNGQALDFDEGFLN